MVNAQCLLCHSPVPTDGADEGSRTVQVTTQRLQRTSPPLGGHFRIQLSDTVIPGKGANGVGVQRFSFTFLGAFPGQQHPVRSSGMVQS